MGCQRDIAAKIIEKQADYILGLKANQPSLHDDVALYYKDILENGKQYEEIDVTKTNDRGHGRIEERTYYLTSDIDWLHQKPDWAGLQGIGAVHSVVKEKGEIRTENRYFITSLTNINGAKRSGY